MTRENLPNRVSRGTTSLRVRRRKKLRINERLINFDIWIIPVALSEKKGGEKIGISPRENDEIWTFKKRARNAAPSASKWKNTRHEQPLIKTLRTLGSFSQFITLIEITTDSLSASERHQKDLLKRRFNPTGNFTFYRLAQRKREKERERERREKAET